jgi:hypothetical protein
VCLINQVNGLEPLPPPSIKGLLKTLPEGLHVCLESLDAAVSLQGTPWISFSSNIRKYPPAVRDAKQPNGHARTRLATIAEVKRTTLGKHIGVLFVGAEADPEILCQFSRVAVVVLEVRDVHHPPDALLAAVPLKGVSQTLLYKGDDNVTQPTAHVVFYGGDGPPPTWPVKAFSELSMRCELKVRGVCDLWAYLPLLCRSSAQGWVDRPCMDRSTRTRRHLEVPPRRNQNIP